MEVVQLDNLQCEMQVENHNLRAMIQQEDEPTVLEANTLNKNCAST